MAFSRDFGCNIVESLPIGHECGEVAGVALPPPNGSINVEGIQFEPAADAPVLSAAIKVVPEPKNASRTKSPRAEQSSRASATRATGLQQGWSARRLPSSPLFEVVLIERYSQTLVRFLPNFPSWILLRCFFPPFRKTRTNSCRER